MKKNNQSRHCRAWTFVEMLVAISLSAIFMGTGALVLQSITHNSKRLTNLIDVNIGAAKKNNFYGQSGSTLKAYTAPNYGKIAFAQDMREQMLSDASRSSAVFILPRSGLNTLRPEFIPYPSGAVGSTADHPVFDTPEAFRQYIRSIFPLKAAVFDSPIRNKPHPSKINTTVFMLGPQTNPDFIRVYAIYDFDYAIPAGAGGIYVSVRRYKNNVLSNYYDFFCKGVVDDATNPSPQFVVFESRNRLAKSEGVAIDRFKVAPNSPFYLLWLPDPAINFLKMDYTGISNPPATSPSAVYYKRGRTSSFMLALPMFPALK